LKNRAPRPTLFHRLQDYSLRVSWKSELKPQLEDIFDGVIYRPVVERIEAIQQQDIAQPRVRRAAHARRRRQRAHQHPGELRQLRDAADRQCRGRAHHGAGAGARRRVSGEHGIGITKLEFLAEDRSSPSRLQGRVDPEGRFNKGKLLPGADL
jgi:FAD/FMN-containing dehydrogenase